MGKIGAGETCAPYTLAPCAHHVPATEKYPACPSSEYDTPTLKSKCSESEYTREYSDDKIKAASAYDLSCGLLSGKDCIAKVQQDVMQCGCWDGASRTVRTTG